MWEGVKLFLLWVRDSLVPVFDLFRDERVAIGLSLALFVIAAASALWFWFHHIAPWLKSLKRAEARVAEATDAAAFLDRFADIDASIDNDNRLAHGWGEFRESLIIPDGGDARGLIRNTARPQLYLNAHSAVEAGLPLPSYLALPNVFVGLGLLFTFIGLVAALHFAAEGVTSADVAEAQQSLQSLLKAATFKFMTSITGVSISLTLSWLFRRLVRKLQMRFERLCTALEKRLEFVSAASLADEQLRELSKQTLQLERFNTDFAVELAQVLDDRLNRTLSTSLSQAVEPVVSAVNSLSGNMGSMSQGAIETMIRDFQTGLKQSTGEEMGSVVSALGQVRETLEHAAAGLQANGADFGSRLDQVAANLEQRLGTAVQGMGDNLASTARELERVLRELSERMRSDALGASAGLSAAMTAAGERTLAALNEAGSAFSAEVRGTAAGFAEALGKSLAILPNFEQTLRTLDARFARQVDAFDASTGQLRTLVAELERGSRSLNAAASPIAATASQFAAASQRIEAAGSALRDARQGFAELNAQLKDTFDANRRVWEEYRTRFEQVDTHLEGVVRQLTDGTRAYHQEIAAFVTNLDAQLEKAVSSFSGAVLELSEVTEGLEEQMRGANGGSRHDHRSRPGRPL